MQSQTQVLAPASSTGKLGLRKASGAGLHSAKDPSASTVALSKQQLIDEVAAWSQGVRQPAKKAKQKPLILSKPEDQAKKSQQKHEYYSTTPLPRNESTPKKI